MFSTKFRIAAILILTILVISAERVLFPCGAYSEAAPAPEQAKVPKEMLEKRAAEADLIWEMKVRMMQTAHGKLSDFFGWSERLLDAQLALVDKKEDRVKALQAHVDRTRSIERLAAARVKHARDTADLAHTATYERINAEIRYFQEAGKVPPPPPPKEKDDLPIREKKP